MKRWFIQESGWLIVAMALVMGITVVYLQITVTPLTPAQEQARYEAQVQRAYDAYNLRNGRDLREGD